MRPLVTAALMLLSCLAPAFAVGMERPTGPVLLTIEGAIATTNENGRARFDRAMLTRLGVVRMRTTTPWTDGVVEFEGVPMRAVLDSVGARGKLLRATAVNDYAIDLDADEFVTVPALLAYRMNGIDLRLRDKGPLWLVYPRDAYPALREDVHNFKWIWQLKTITVR